MSIRTLAVVLSLIAGLPGAALAQGDARGQAVAQVEFGIAVAQKGLWQEAVYRWQRATEIDPTYAAAFNNLAVAYEQLGRFEEAGQAYARALELEPDNLSIQQNYDLFKELNDRARRSQTR
jgi:Flp pilus assembly protein TadD